MNIYLISQTDACDYDTYDAVVVAAESEDDARLINPSGEWQHSPRPYRSWCATPDLVTVQLLGMADTTIDRGIILASFNAG